jgi:hypothetical protein
MNQRSRGSELWGTHGNLEPKTYENGYLTNMKLESMGEKRASK